MKYAFMSFSCPARDLDGILELAARTGYDGIEPRISAGHGHGLEFDTPAPVRQAAREKGASHFFVKGTSNAEEILQAVQSLSPTSRPGKDPP